MNKQLSDLSISAGCPARIRFFANGACLYRAGQPEDAGCPRLLCRALFVMVLAGYLLFPRYALADQCKFTSVPSVMNFGSIDSGEQGTLSQPVQWQCTSGLLNLQALTAACYTVEPVAGGLSGTTRIMKGTGGLAASYNLLFNLDDSAQNVLLGARVTAQFGNAPQTTLITGNIGIIPIWATYNPTVTGNIPANQIVPAGTYSTTSSIYVFYRSALLGVALDCWNGNSISNTVTIQATVQPLCNASATSINFGTQSTLTRPLYAQGAITVNCTLAQPYQISLATNGFPPDQRRMINSNQYIQYGLYTDPAYSNPWGTAAPVAGTGTGTDQILPVYARVPVQSTPGGGTYNDTVAITVTY